MNKATCGAVHENECRTATKWRACPLSSTIISFTRGIEKFICFSNNKFMIDAFFTFITDRQTIWHKRFVENLPGPWTDDPILGSFRFCNIYRQLDAGTIAITNHICGGNLSPQQKLFNIVAYRFFNKKDTIKTLFGGPLNNYDFDFAKLEKQFDSAKLNENIFNNAYLVSSHNYNPNYRPGEKHIQILMMLRDLAPKMDEFTKEIMLSTPDNAISIINKFVPLSGPFLAGQILLDATYTKDLVKFTDNDFLIVGPGAKWGLDIIFNENLSAKDAIEKCKYLHSVQSKFLDDKWMQVRWQNPDYSNASYISLHDIQNSLCEFRKYWRLSNGENGRKRYYKS